MNFCPNCGSPVERKWIEADQRERNVCSRCETIHYQNPRILVTAMITWQGRLLICRRAHQPSKGLWIPPGGFMEQGETLEEATARELREETGVRIDPDQLLLYTVTNLPMISEVYIVFRGAVEDPQIDCGPESLEAAFFAEADIPWSELAYPETASYLRLFFREQNAKDFGIHLSKADRISRARTSYRLREPGEPGAA